MMQKHHIVGLALVGGLLLLTIIRSSHVSSLEAPQSDSSTETVEIPKDVEKPAEELSEAQKRKQLIEDNPYNCNTATQYIVWPDGKCSDKTVQTVAPSGSWVERCERWAEMAGIPFNSTALKILEKESHCNPVARNPSSSAGGIPQALPWTKMECDLSWSDEDAVCQMKWFWSYVSSRYGSYEKAWAFHVIHNWY